MYILHNNYNILLKFNQTIQVTKLLIAIEFQIIVKDLFYNQPVRQKSSDLYIEAQNIKASMEKVALIFPKISFSLYEKSGKTYLIRLNSCKTIIDRYYQIYNKDTNKSFITVNSKLNNFTADVSIGDSFTKYKDQQFIYINGRSMECKKIKKYMNKQLTKLIGESNKDAETLPVDEKFGVNIDFNCR